jgi:hypothetical protein
MTRRVKNVLYIAVGIVVLSCGMCGGCLYKAAREVPAVTRSAGEFMDLLSRSRVDQAYAGTTPAFQANTSLDRFRSLIAQFPAFTKQDRRSAGGVRIYTSGDALVGYNIANSQNTLSLSLMLRKVQGQWKVQSIILP